MAPDRIALLQGTLDLIVLQALSSMGPLHAYAGGTPRGDVEASAHAESGDAYASLVRLDQKGWIKGVAHDREQPRGEMPELTKAGGSALEKQTERWRRLAGLVDQLLLEKP